MVIRDNLCIGCGVCASNCPNNAISLEKVRNVVPVKTQAEMEKMVRAERIH
jgi:ferredoxin